MTPSSLHTMEYSVPPQKQGAHLLLKIIFGKHEIIHLLIVVNEPLLNAYSTLASLFVVAM